MARRNRINRLSSLRHYTKRQTPDCCLDGDSVAARMAAQKAYNNPNASGRRQKGPGGQGLAEARRNA